MPNPTDNPFVDYELLGIITQSGAAAPTMVLGINAMPFGVGTWSYVGVGSYLYTITGGVFLANKTFCLITNGPGGGSGPFVRFGRASATTLQLTTVDETQTPADSLLDNATIQVLMMKQ